MHLTVLPLKMKNKNCSLFHILIFPLDKILLFTIFFYANRKQKKIIQKIKSIFFSQILYIYLSIRFHIQLAGVNQSFSIQYSLFLVKQYFLSLKLVLLCVSNSTRRKELNKLNSKLYCNLIFYQTKNDIIKKYIFFSRW